MKMKQLLSVLFILLLSSASLLTANGNTEQKTVNVNTEQKAANVKLEFWDMPWGGANYFKTASALVDEYNASHPGIVVNYQPTPWSNWYQTFTTAIASGTAPDISTGAGYQAFQFTDVGAILPIDNAIEKLKANGQFKDFNANDIELMKYKGFYRALPWEKDIRVIYYRKEILNESGVTPPQNWAEFRTALKNVTNKEKNVYGLAISGAAPNSGVHFLLTFLLNNGGGLFDKNGAVDVLNNRNKETINYLSSLVKDGSINPNSAGLGSGSDEASFVRGESAFFLSSPGLENKYPELKDKIAILPPMEGLHGDKAILGWINNIMLYKQSKFPKETMNFLLWWSENSYKLFSEGNVTGLPSRNSLLQKPYFANNVWSKQIINEYVPIMKTTAANAPMLFPALNEIEGDNTLMNCMQEILMGIPSEKVLTDLNLGILKIMDKKKD